VEYNDILEVKNLTVYYEIAPAPVKAVEGVNFNVKSGEIFGIVGESGCGKSTLALSIARLLRPPGRIINGEIIFEGINILKLSPEALKNIRWKKISYIPQSSMNSLNPIAKIGEQIEEVIKIHEHESSKKSIKERVKELLINVGLSPEISKMYPHELSGGMRQRAIIAMALALNPKLIIADEPTTALDVVVERGILQLLLDIKHALNISIVLITHNIAVQAEVADRIAVLYAGKIVEIRSVNDLFKNPLHPYSRALISSIPSITERRVLKGLPGFPPDLRHPPSGCRFHPRCSYAMPGICNIKDPPLLEIKGGLVACHLYGDST
jgi:peptide/nickel transport system ATP-binding protein